MEVEEKIKTFRKFRFATRATPPPYKMYINFRRIYEHSFSSEPERVEMDYVVVKNDKVIFQSTTGLLKRVTEYRKQNPNDNRLFVKI
jgi:hypothetical protein